MNVVALISGGKDSLLSILHLLANGHNVIALGNVFPTASDGKTVDDLDSAMYQTIGHNVIPLYGQALGLPLYRQETVGHAVRREKTYEAPSPDGIDDQDNASIDETEDLLLLLQRIMEAHPQVNAVSTGAILSDYQRTRVESVALRLGLTPISYLWQYPRIVTRSPTSLLEDMAVVGQESRIIKVSSGGLDDSFLGQNVADRRTIQRLVTASQRFGSSDDGAVLGEGGEYETLALSGPAPLWKGKIHVDENQCQVCPGEAGSASLRLKNATVSVGVAAAPAEVPQPPLLDAHFETIFTDLESETWTEQAPIRGSSTDLEREVAISTDQWIFLGGFTASRVERPQSTTREQTLFTLNKIGAYMASHAVDFSDVAFTTVILRDMADFADVNAVFQQGFDRPNPPARAAIACADILGPGERIMISMTISKPHSSLLRQGLHVQSISYWAPANIGPYSQAITVPLFELPGFLGGRLTTTFIAGQIPLVPASMELDVLLDASKTTQFLHQAVLSLQHAFRVARAAQVQRWMHAIAFVTAPDDAVLYVRSAIAEKVWQKACTPRQLPEDQVTEDEDENFDVWHSHHGASRPLIAATGQGEQDFYAALSTDAPSLTVIHIDSLPRGADVEWVVFGTNMHLPGLQLEHYNHLVKLFSARIVRGGQF